MRFKLERVQYMPQQLNPGVLYVAEQFGAVAHLCPCGCGTKVRTPLGPTEWALEETAAGPSLSPSIGNWQHPCQSHYWITRGEVEWAKQLAPADIATGRQREAKRREAYYSAKARPSTMLGRLQRWLMERLPVHHKTRR